MTQLPLFTDPAAERRAHALVRRGVHPRTAQAEGYAAPDDAMFWRRLTFADQLAAQRVNLTNPGGFILSVLRDHSGEKYGPVQGS